MTERQEKRSLSELLAGTEDCVSGPWNAKRAYRVYRDGQKIALIVPEDGENPVASMTNDYTEEATRANAALIAAAPVMADRLRAIDAAVQASMSSRDNYTLMALSETILRVQRILNGGK